jgi:glycosyltransferase involved in cell wall biosynthesis
MKIALFHNLPPGGAKRALFEHARHLRERGYVLDAYMLSTADEGYLPLAPLCRDVFVYAAPAARGPRSVVDHPVTLPFWKIAGQGVRKKAEHYVQIQAQIRALEALEAVYGQMAAEIDARGYDLVYVHHCRFLSSPYLLRRLRTPSVYYCADTLRHVHEWAVATRPDYDALPEPWGRRKIRGQIVAFYDARLWQEQERRDTANARAATLVLANSWYSREAILRAYGVDARVCYLGVNSDFFCPDPATRRENTVLSVGSITPAKRHDFILRAIATIPPARRPQMQIIGYDASLGKTHAGSMAEALLRFAQERGITLRISQEVSDDVLRDSYRRAGVVAFAPHLEPFGFISLEAMACGTPVVGVSEGGLRESIEDGVTGLLTDRDEEEFGGALDRILTDKPLADALGANGRVAAGCKWTWSRSVDRLERHFQRVVGPAPSG